MTTLVLTAEECLEHDPGRGHPERPARLQAIQDDLAAHPVAGTVQAHPRKATRDELLAVHAPEHVKRMEATAGRLHVQLDADTATSSLSHEAALYSAGATLEATEAVVEGRASGAFALVRPPGHHAGRDAAMGFCLYNNVAAAAEHAVRELGCRRVLVLDPDVHHGNGTQDLFWQRDDVLYVSSHRYPFYPGTGAVDDIGAGRGAGFTINLPLPEASTDANLLHGYREVVAPVVAEWQPDLILVSAGFDTWHVDPMGGFLVTERGYASLFALFRSWADAHAPGRIALTLEGGYNTTGLVAGVRAALGALTAERVEAEPLDEPVGRAAREMAARARTLLAPCWKNLRQPS